MRISNASLHPYSLPFYKTFSTSRESYRERRGVLILLESSDGVRGYGDIAPLAEFNNESLEEAVVQAKATIPELLECKLAQEWEELLKLSLPSKLHPSVRFGFETALLDLLGHRRSLPCASLLSPHFSPEIQVNLLLSRDFNPSSLSGFGTFKLKVGERDVRKEIEFIRSTVSRIPKDAKLRLDCNQAYAFTDAKWLLDEAMQIPTVEYVEEPLKAPTLRTLSLLAEGNDLLALDESLTEPANYEAVFTGVLPATPIVKPTAVGGILRTLDLFKALESRGKCGVITSALESVVGVQACAHTAAAIGNKLASGLATSRLYARDVGVDPSSIFEGTLLLPSSPGLGVDVQL